MDKKPKLRILVFIAVLLFVSLACNLPSIVPTASWQPVLESPGTPIPGEPPASAPTVLPTPVVEHVNFPGTSTGFGQFIYDVESSGTAPEKRAPYGDRYQIYRMERPFTQEMNYIPDMDIVLAMVTVEDDWVYVSIELIGSNPNNDIGIRYGVEIDIDHDGFGEYIIWATPPYQTEWTTDGVQIFSDQNHDTGGISAEGSDAPFSGNGYETKIFDAGVGYDPDLVWVRVVAGERAIVQFAFKASLPGSSFMLGVLADANFRDVTKMFYNDYLTEAEAGSPQKGEAFYPLKGLYAFDNTCREAFGFHPNGYEPLLCPRPEPTPGPAENASEDTLPTEPPPPQPTGCQPPPGGCTNGWWVGEPDCYCTPY